MNRFTQHLVFWVIILFFQVTRSLPGNFNAAPGELTVVLMEHLMMLPILISASYLTADLIFPRFYTKRYLLFAYIHCQPSFLFS